MSKTTWRAEARCAADEYVVVSCAAEGAERFPGMIGVLAEINLRNNGWYSFKTMGRDGTEKRIFVEVRQYPLQVFARG